MHFFSFISKYPSLFSFILPIYFFIILEKTNQIKIIFAYFMLVLSLVLFLIVFILLHLNHLFFASLHH